jgi:hypothetical protein
MKEYRQAVFNFTLFAGENDISSDLGQSAFKLTTYAELHSNTRADK